MPQVKWYKYKRRRTGDGSLSFSAEELNAQMVAKYGQETIDAVCADADTSGWTREQWIAKLNENREKKEQEDEAESGINSERIEYYLG